MTSYDFSGIPAWSRIPGWFDLAKAIAVQQRVKRLPPGAKVVELGSYQGRSSIAIAAVLPPGAVLHCVDHFQGSAEHHAMQLDVTQLFDAFCRHVREFGVADRIRVLKESTTEAADRFPAASCDLILLDASHDFESVCADLDAWYPKLRPGGTLFCDDFDPRWPGVQRAVHARGLVGAMAAKALWVHTKPGGA
ncbi:MAG: class I SAM-dependent methyltransferase [Pirellulaceae bacterium]